MFDRKEQRGALFSRALFLLGLVEKVDEVVLPDGGLGVGAVAAGGISDGEKDELRVGHQWNHFFCHAEFGRVDEVVGGVDPKDRSGDGGEFGRGVVVAGGVDVVEEVVGIRVGVAGGDAVVDVGLDLGAGGVVLLELERSAAGEEEEIVGEGDALDGLGGVLAVLPGGVVADGLHRHVAPFAVASGEFDRLAGEGSEGVDELRIGLAPDKALHAAHGGAEDEAEVIDVKAVDEHGVLGGDHVVVVVLREVHVEAVGGFAGFAVADVVGEDDEVFGDVEGLSGSEEDVGEGWVHQGVGVAASAVEEEDSIIDVAGGVAMEFAEGEVMELEHGERFSAAELEALDDVGSVLGGPLGRSLACGLGG
jgi:hypothetical protein